VTELLDRLKTALPDRYRIERELDRGALAVVFLVHDQKLNRPAHFKVLRPERASALDARRFLEELGPAVKLKHPSISGPYRYGAAGGLLYYVVPLVKGESLRQRLTREVRLSIEQTIEITRSVAAALDYAHREGIVHREIRPENILLPGGQAVVADFGVARAVRIAAGERPETALSPGKPYYMSPEQVLGDEVGGSARRSSKW
jgi:serine/threonine-protein kinase